MTAPGFAAAGFNTITGLLAVHLAGFAALTGLLLAFLILRVTEPAAARHLLDAALAAMAATLATGWALAFAEQGPPAQWSWTLNAMQALGIAMAVLLLVARYGALFLLDDRPAPRDSLTGHGAHSGPDPASRRLTRLVAMSLALGAVTLVIAVAGRYG